MYWSRWKKILSARACQQWTGSATLNVTCTVAWVLYLESAWFCLLKIIVVTEILWKIWRSLTENILWLFCGLLGDFYGPSKIITSQYSVSDQQKFLWGSRIPEMSICVRTWMQVKKNTPVASYPFPDSYCQQLLCIQTPPGRTGIGICRIQVPLVIPL